MDPPREAHPGPPKPLDDAIAEYLMACEVEGKSPRPCRPTPRPCACSAASSLR